MCQNGTCSCEFLNAWLCDFRIFIAALLNFLSQVDTFRNQNHVSSHFRSDFGSSIKLRVQLQFRNAEHEWFTSLLKGIDDASYYIGMLGQYWFLDKIPDAIMLEIYVAKITILYRPNLMTTMLLVTTSITLQGIHRVLGMHM